MMSKSLLPMFSSRSFYVLGSFVSVFNPFWVFSGLWCNKVIKFHSFVYVCPAFPTPFIKECLFIVYSCFLCHRLIDRIGVELHSVLYSTPLIYVNVCMLVPCGFDYYSLVVQLISGNGIPPTLFFLKNAVAVQGLLWFHINC